MACGRAGEANQSAKAQKIDADQQKNLNHTGRINDGRGIVAAWTLAQTRAHTQASDSL